MRNHIETTGSIDRKYRTRAKAAAWLSGLSLVGATAYESANAQPATAGTEAAARAEVTPKAFINKLDKRLAVLGKELISAKGVKLIKGTNPWLKGPKDVRVYYLAVPAKQPHHYDLMEFIMRHGSEYPIAAGVSFNSNTNKWDDDNVTVTGGMLINQSDPVNHEFTPGYVELLDVHGKNVTRYCAAAVSPFGQPPFGKASMYSDFKPASSSVVSKQFNEFFEAADRVIENSSK